VASEGQTVTNEQGGKQAFTEADFSQIPPFALRLLAQCCGFGSRKYGPGNWKKISIESQIAHAMNHLNEFRLGDRSEPHLVNAAVRVMFALELAVEQGAQEPRYIHPDMTRPVTSEMVLSDFVRAVGVASFDRKGFYRGAPDADTSTKPE
jgi:hypothetical protein